MAGVIEFKPSKRFSGQAKKTRRPRKKVETTKTRDPRIAVENRTFEIVRCYPLGGGDGVIERRIRIRINGKGGLEDEVYEVGTTECYCGMVSEHLGSSRGRDNWSPYTWGHVPVTGTDWVREIINDDPPLKATKKDEKRDGEAV